MAAARFWRLVGLQVAAQGDLELSEVALFSGATRVDSGAAVSSSHPPLSGALSNLQDGDVATHCRFDGEKVRSSGFFIKWDLGSAVSVTELRLAAADSLARFCTGGQLSFSDDGALWIAAGEWMGATYPGDREYTASAFVSTATWNDADKHATVTLSFDKLQAEGAPSLLYGNVRCDAGISADKFYWEISVVSLAGAAVLGVGVASSSASLGGSASTYIGADSGGIGYYSNDGRAYRSGAAVGSGAATPFLAGDVIGVALDRDANVVRLYRNGVLVWTISSLPTGTLFPVVSLYSGARVSANFGNTGFFYTPPAGHTGISDAPALPSMGPLTPSTCVLQTAVVASSPLELHSAAGPFVVFTARDAEHGGLGTIYGTTKTKGTPNAPTKARVVLQHQRSKLPVRETWSDQVTGNFAFTGIDTTQQFLTLAEDAAGNFRPVAANRLTPEVLP